MADKKKEEGQHNDVTFSRDRLVDDDPRIAEAERELRNSPMPEEYRSDPSKLDGWPVPEDRKPAVMRADQKDSLDYKLATYEDVDDADRDLELAGAPGDVARREFNKQLRENRGQDMNELQAPPTPAAKAAAEGGGADFVPVPVNPLAGLTANLVAANEAAARQPAARSSKSDNK